MPFRSALPVGRSILGVFMAMAADSHPNALHERSSYGKSHPGGVCRVLLARMTDALHERSSYVKSRPGSVCRVLLPAGEDG